MDPFLSFAVKGMTIWGCVMFGLGTIALLVYKIANYKNTSHAKVGNFLVRTRTVHFAENGSLRVQTTWATNSAGLTTNIQHAYPYTTLEFAQKAYWERVEMIRNPVGMPIAIVEVLEKRHWPIIGEVLTVVNKKEV